MILASLYVALFLLSMLSGMIGIGVAFPAVPLLSLALPDLVNQVHPLSLALNGVTALCAVIGFAWAGLVDWRRAVPLALATTLAAPVGALAAGYAREWMVWAAFALAAAYFMFSMFHPAPRQPWHVRFAPILAWAIPISMFSGFIGVGPGFLLVPTMMRHGVDIKRAAALSAFAATPASFAAIVPRWAEMEVSAELALPLLLVVAAGALLGARLTATRISPITLRKVFAAAIIAALAYRVLHPFV
ncbi:MAG: sulfite exporter TauE/SafE family protein [Betaproteobacteria bacterium HGW-Betaproteobacteria-14]|jgi:uncharacterized membrane protein YfcA|nr:MAG: sulfite exporter TauE/SafE family protein [Betaproteobacteria bacterium HGW-Betaproteobacteria-14]